MTNFIWNIDLIFIRLAWLGDKPYIMATWWNIGRLYWRIHPRFRINYRTKAYLKKEYIRSQALKGITVGNFKELWEALDNIYSYVETLNVGILKGREYLEPNPMIYAQEIITAIAKHNVDERDKRLTGHIDLCEIRDKYMKRWKTVEPEVDKLRWVFQDALFKLLLEIRHRNQDTKQDTGEKLAMRRAIKAWWAFEEYRNKSSRLEPTPEGERLKAVRNQALEEANLAL